MYDNNYEEYIRSVLGYPNMPNMNQNTMYNTGYSDMSQANTRKDLESCYPEIYKIIYPMVKKACERNINANSREEIEQMTDEIYSALEDNNQINVNINLGNTISTTNSNKTENRNEIYKESQGEISGKQEMENRNMQTQSRRRPSNNNLRDLIKILLIREILGRPGHHFPPHHRPPRPPHNPPRPPMRPPIMPRDYQQPLYDIYEY